MDDFLLLLRSKIMQKYPDKKNPDTQEYRETDYILEFWIQGL
jgi:hypothetical protein